MSLSKERSRERECLLAFKKCKHPEAVKLMKDSRNVCTYVYVRDTDIPKIGHWKDSRVGLLHLAIWNGWLDVTETLIDKYHIEPQKGGYDIYTLHVAVVAKRINILKYLITKWRCDPMCKDSRALTSLHYAAQYGSLNVMKYLITKCHCDPMCEDNDRRTSLNYAVRVGSINVMKYLITECNCNPMVTTKEGGFTCLHEAVMNKQYSSIEYLLSTGKVDPLVKDKFGETPLQRAKANDKMRSLFIKFGKVETSHPVDSYVNVLLLGNPGAGKSTLAQVIIERAISTPVFGQFRTVKGVELCTAGIIPTKLQHKELGNIILHDFAGHSEYYTSHTAVIENLLQGSAAVFVVLVNIMEEEANKHLQQWLTIVTNEVHKALSECHIIVVISHVDEMTDTFTYSRKQTELQQIIRQRCDTHVSIEYLDCRKLGGRISSLLSNLSSACQSIRNTSGRNLSLYCHMMYGLLEESKQNILSFSDIISAAQTNENYILPDRGEEILEILSSLHSTGLISLLKSTDDTSKVWVVTNKQILLAEVDGILFAPKTFKQHCDIASNTGVVTVSALAELFPCYDPDMLICFLKNMALCQEIHPQFLEMTNLIAKGAAYNNKERFLFFPTLLNIDRPDNINQQVQFQFGWCLQCTEDYHFFPSHFFHVLLLCLAYKFGLPEHTSKLPIVNRQCTFWKNGIHWFNGKGIGTLVELVDGGQCVLVLMSCEEGYEKNMVSLQRDVITEVTTVQKESCPGLKLLDFVIDPQDLTYSIDKPTQRTVYNVQDIISCIIRKEDFVNNKPHSNKVRSSKRLQQVLPNESILLTNISQLSVLGGHDLKVY